MDQTTINLALSAALAVAGWFGRQLWEAVQKLKDDMDKRMDHIEDMFKRIYDKLDGKADK